METCAHLSLREVCKTVRVGCLLRATAVAVALARSYAGTCLLIHDE